MRTLYVCQNKPNQKKAVLHGPARCAVEATTQGQERRADGQALAAARIDH